MTVAAGPRVGGAHVNVALKMDRKSLDVLGGQIQEQLARLGKRNRAVYQALGRDTVIAWRAALGAIVTSAPLVGSAISGVAGAATMLAGAMYSTAQSSFALYTVLGSVGIAAVTARIGFEGFNDAISAANPEELAKALERLSPAARDSALAVRSLADGWTRLRLTVQENVFAGLSDEISKLNETLLPVLERGLGKVATSLNGLFDSLLQYINSESGLKQINTVLDGAADIFARLSEAAVPVLDGLLRLFNALIPAGQRLADRITDIALRFQSWTQAEGFGNRINEMMLRAEKTAGLLFEVLGNLGRAISNVFSAGNAETNNFLQLLVDVTQRFQDWSSSVEGQNSIAVWLQGATEVMKAFGRATASVFNVIQELADPRVISNFLDTVAGAFDIISQLPLEAFIDAFVRVAQAIQPVSEVFLAVIIAAASFNIVIGTVVAQLSGLTALLTRFTGGKGLKEFFNSIRYAGVHVGPLASRLSGLLSLIGRFARFAGPIGIAVWIASIIARSDELKAKIGNVWDSLKGVFSALSDAFSQVGTSLGPVISGLSPVFDLLEKIAGLAIGVVLDAIVLALDSLANTITGIGGIISGFIDTLVGLFTLDWSKMFSGLETIIDSLGPLLQGILGLFITFLGPARLLKIGSTALKGLWGGIRSVFPSILSGLGQFILQMLRFFITLTPRLIYLGWKALTSFGGAIVRAAPGIISKVVSLISGIVSKFSGLPGRLLSLAKSAVGKVAGAFSAGISRLRTIAGEITGAIRNKISALPGQLYSIGSNMVSRLVDGILSKIQAVKNAASRVVGAFKNFWPGSPVKEGPLTAWNYGSDASGGGRTLIDSIVKGLRDVSPIEKAMDDVASAVARSLTPNIGKIALAGSASSVQNTRHTSITINNPTPELASDSLTRTTRNLAYLGLT